MRLGPRYKHLMGLTVIDPQLRYFWKIKTFRNPCKKCLVQPTCRKVGDDVCNSKNRYYETWAYIEHYKAKAKIIPKTAWLFIKDVIEPVVIRTIMTILLFLYAYCLFLWAQLIWTMWTS